MLDFAYFEKNYRIIAVDLSKQKALDADSRAIQQIIFTGEIKPTVADTRVIIFYVLEKSKRNNIRIFKRNNKTFVSNSKIQIVITNYYYDYYYDYYDYYDYYYHYYD